MTDPARSTVSRLREEMPFDLFLGVPTHRVPEVVAESGMCVDGWIPVDCRTLETAYPGVYAVGDVTSVETPKAGVFAERQASVVADQIIARLGRGPGSAYDGKGICYIEFGHERVARVEVTFIAGQRPMGSPTSRPPCCWPTRPSSGPAACGGGSTATGATTEPGHRPRLWLRSGVAVAIAVGTELGPLISAARRGAFEEDQGDHNRQRDKPFSIPGQMPARQPAGETMPVPRSLDRSHELY